MNGISMSGNVLQGDLQTVFDVLYEMGVIEPVLQRSWADDIQEMESGSARLNSAVRTANKWCHDAGKLKSELARLEPRALEFLAIAVAQEFALFHRKPRLVH